MTAGFLNLCRAACQTDHRVGWRASLVRDVREAASTRAWSGGNAQKVSRDQPTKALRERSPGQWRDAAARHPATYSSRRRTVLTGVCFSANRARAFSCSERPAMRAHDELPASTSLPVDRAGIQHAVASLVGTITA